MTQALKTKVIKIVRGKETGSGQGASMCVRGTVGKPFSQDRELIVLSCSNKLVLRAQISQLSQIVCLLHIRAVTYDGASL